MRLFQPGNSPPDPRNPPGPLAFQFSLYELAYRTRAGPRADIWVWVGVDEQVNGEISLLIESQGLNLEESSR